MGTEHDNWLNQGSDGPKELDEDDMERALETVEDRLIRDCRVPHVVDALYKAYPAMKHVLRELDLPAELAVPLARLANMCSDIRAEIDNEYAARTAAYYDPRD